MNFHIVLVHVIKLQVNYYLYVFSYCIGSCYKTPSQYIPMYLLLKNKSIVGMNSVINLLMDSVVLS